MKRRFNSATEFWEHCNAVLPSRPSLNEDRPAIIPTSSMFGFDSHVRPLPDGRCRIGLLVCGAPEGFFMISDTPRKIDDLPLPGELVLWRPMQKPPLLGKGMLGTNTNDKRSSWMGFVIAKIAPEIDDETGEFTLLSRYA